MPKIATAWIAVLKASFVTVAMLGASHGSVGRRQPRGVSFQ